MSSLTRITWLAAAALLPAIASAQGLPPLGAGAGSGSEQVRGGRPANLCQELVAFVHAPDPAQKGDPQPAQLSSAVQAPKSGSPVEKPAAAGSPQQTSGQSGQVARSGPGADGPQGNSQNASAPAGATATAQTQAPPSGQPGQPASPPPATAPNPAKPSPEFIQQVDAAASSNDLSACRAAAQRMRRAGVVMPTPLLALAAMDPVLLKATQQP